jgi:hypothetical protein
VQASLFDSGRRQEEAALASTKADLPSLPEYKNLLLAAQKQLIELPFIVGIQAPGRQEEILRYCAKWRNKILELATKKRMTPISSKVLACGKLVVDLTGTQDV